MSFSKFVFVGISILFSISAFAETTVKLKTHCWPYNKGIFFDYTGLMECQDASKLLNASSNRQITLESTCTAKKNILCNGVRVKWAAVLTTRATLNFNY